jgi:hypothetical protein
MRHLLAAATCLTPAALLAAAATPARAEVVIGTTVTSPVRTATAAANGTADDVRITSAGTVRPASGNAVTIDSNDNVTNEGTIQVTGANNATGILAAPGFAGTISSTGKIILDEAYTPADADNDGDLDGPFAQGSNRVGIRVAPGGTFTGNVTAGGAITIEGNDSSGIALDGRLAGNLTHNAATDVLGNASHGIRAGEVTGNVLVNGAIAVRGAGSVGVALDGNVGGRVVFQGTVTATGYRSTTIPANLSRLDADDVLQGGPAVRVAGSVAQGILFDAPPPDTSTTDADEDKDGTPDAQEATATIRSYGSAPAVVIGAAAGTTAIGAVPGTTTNGHGIVVRGTISGEAVYPTLGASGMVIGGQGGTVQVAGGLTNSGAIGATANAGAATALRIGAGATVPEIRSSGTILATGGGAGNAVTALAVDQNAALGAIRNTGRIEAAATGGAAGTAILDRSSGLTLIENAGIIGASAAGTNAAATAIDASNSTANLTVRQIAPASAASTSRITGAIRFGAGNDLLDVQSGTVTGNTSFGAGADRLNLSNAARYTGDVDFAGGGADQLNLAGTSVFTGRLLNAGNLAVNVTGGTLNLTGTGPVAIGSLSVGAAGAIGVAIDPATGAFTRYNVAGQASFAQGSEIVVTLTRTAGAEGNYLIVDAASLSGVPNLGLDAAVLPFLYLGSLSANQAAGDLSLNIRRRTAAELGLNASESAAYNAVYAALSKDAAIEDAFLLASDSAGVRAAIRQMLPDHAGGTFEGVTQASRATTRFLADPNPPVLESGDWGFILQQVAWGTSKDLGDTGAYDVDGWGASGAVEFRTGDAGAFGVSLSYLLGRDRDGSTDNEVTASQYELGAYWRGRFGPLAAFVRGSAARIDFSSDRSFAGTAAAGAFTRETEGEWNGTLLSGAAGLSYEIRSGRIAIRPAVSVDYYRLKEGAYVETGGGNGFALSVDGRTSDETAANASLALGYDIDRQVDGRGGWLRIEAEGGRRQILSGELGATTARFTGGQDFTLTPEERTSGWTGRLRLIGGTSRFRFGGEVGAEEQQGRAAVSGRLTLHSSF